MPNGLLPDMSYVSDLAGKKCLVVGAGVTGKAVARALRKFSALPILFDENAKTDLEVVSEIPKQIDMAVISPGWRRDHPVILKLQQAGVVIISEVDFAWKIKEELAPKQRWVGLTGTNGKTTTIKMVESIFKSAKINGAACGNEGQTVIESVTRDEPYDLLALELSSFQIQWSDLPKYEAVAILNIAEDHIDWHGSFESYAGAKLKLLSQGKRSILNKSDPELAKRVSSNSATWFSLDTPSPGELGVVENLLVDRAFSPSSNQANEVAEIVDVTPTVPHNVLNALAAAAIALSVNISYTAVKDGLKKFSTDHHRMELVLNKNEISWVDDSKATNPHAAIASLLSYFNVIWSAGGLAKGASMDELVVRAASRVKSVILIGQDRELIAQAFEKHSPQIPLIRVDHKASGKELMMDVVQQAKQIAKAGDTVLLAPACASMDQFESYVDRGKSFSEAVKALV